MSKQLLRCLVAGGALAVFAGGPVLADIPAQAPQSAQRASQPSSGQTASPQAPAGQPTQGQPGGGRRFGPVPGPLPTGSSDFSPWWKDAAIAKEIGLTADQANKIDRIYEKRRKQTQLHVEEFDKQHAELNRMIAERTVTPDVIELQAQKWMAPRTTLEVSRIKMLYEMSLVLTVDQNKKLLEIVRRANDRGRGGRGPHPR